jgi:hypothetical protein
MCRCSWLADCSIGSVILSACHELGAVRDGAAHWSQPSLERATARRHQAKQTLAEAQRSQPASSRRRRAGQDVPAEPQAARVLAARQATRALAAQLRIPPLRLGAVAAAGLLTHRSQLAAPPRPSLRVGLAWCCTPGL